MGVDAVLSVRYAPSAKDADGRALEILDYGRRLAEAVGSDHFSHFDGRGCLQERRENHAADSDEDDEFVWERGLRDAQGKQVTDSDHRITLDVSFYGRYYGPGYERGNLFAIIAVREWLLQNLPQATVYYGGDNEEHVSELDAPRVRALIAHWASVNGQNYRRECFTGGHAPAPFHPICRVYGTPMVRTGSGGGYASFYSLATGEKVVWNHGKWLVKGDQGLVFSSDQDAVFPVDPALWKPNLQ